MGFTRRPRGGRGRPRAPYGHGDDADSEPLPDRARLDDSLVAKAASAPGARTAVADVTFPGRGPNGPLTAHNWASTVTGEKLISGCPPHTGEVVLAEGKVPVGAHVTVTTPAGPHSSAGVRSSAGAIVVLGVTAASLPARAAMRRETLDE